MHFGARRPTSAASRERDRSTDPASVRPSQTVGRSHGVSARAGRPRGEPRAPNDAGGARPICASGNRVVRCPGTPGPWHETSERHRFEELVVASVARTARAGECIRYRRECAARSIRYHACTEALCRAIAWRAAANLALSAAGLQ